MFQNRIVQVVLPVLAGLATAGIASPASAQPMVPVGVARVDITPDYPIRLTGYSGRKTESEGAAQRIWAKALAIGADEGDGPAMLMTVENCGVPGTITADVAARLKAKCGFKPERLAVCSTHTHTGPWLREFARAIIAGPLPPEHQAHMEKYARDLADKMEQTATAALAARKPGRLAWTQGTVGFAMNRRPVPKGGFPPGVGANGKGPVDHSLPLLCARDAQGKVVAVVINYACHCTTLGPAFNRIHGDWAGVAQECIEAEHPGATALVCLGCGADANPEPRGKVEMAQQHGREVADEVNRLLAGKMTPLEPKVTARRVALQLPFDKVPNREELQKRIAAGRDPKAGDLVKRLGVQATALLAELDRGRMLPAGIDYSVTTWCFGDDLAMVFLPGEVVVDYALRLKRELDGSGLWITAYANDVPCYIASRRVLAEGGYEADTSMIYYDRLSRLSPAVEDKIIEAVKSLVPASFAPRQPGR